MAVVSSSVLVGEPPVAEARVLAGPARLAGGVVAVADPDSGDGALQADVDGGASEVAGGGDLGAVAVFALA